MHFSVEKNSILKKIGAVIVMITALVFFSFNVFGAVNGYHFPVLVSNISTSGNVTATLNVSKFIVNADSVITGGGQIPFLITVELRNNSNQDALVSMQDIYISFDTTCQVSNYELFSTDLHVLPLTSQNPNTDPPLYVVPNNDFSYQGGIVVPANTRLYACTKIYIYSPFDSQTQTWGTPALLSCTINISNVQYGNYAHGDAVDFSTLIDALTGDDDISMTEIADLLDDIKTADNTAFNNIINLLSYTGSTNLPYINGYSDFGTYNLDSINNVTNNTLRWNIGSPCYDSIDYEVDTSNDRLIFHYTYHRHVTIQATFNAVKNMSIDPDMRILYYKFGNNFRGISNIHVTSNNMNSYMDTGTAVFLQTLYTDGQYRHIFITGQNVFRLEYDLYFTDADNTVVLPSSVNNLFYWSHNTVTYIDGDYKLNDIVLYNEMNNTLKDLYNAYSQVNGLDDFSDNSNDVADVSDSNHVIEESYYSANASAIQATGLSNYRFSNEQNNGIGSVSNDFMLLWNALGSWNGVYIFSLTMALATFIMRHRGILPSRTKDDKGGED